MEAMRALTPSLTSRAVSKTSSVLPPRAVT
jgi:hypothetical protein